MKKGQFEALAGKKATSLKVTTVSKRQKGQETGECWNMFLRCKPSPILQFLLCHDCSFNAPQQDPDRCQALVESLVVSRHGKPQPSPVPSFNGTCSA